LFVDGWKKLIEAISIIVVGISIMFITAVSDYMKDSEFVKL
jgi:hypothetical protein